MIDFTPVPGLIGGVLIGSSAAVWLASCGRLAGISNIAHGLLNGLRQGNVRAEAWRIAFLLGMLLSASAYFAWSGAAVNPRTHFSPWLLVLGGLLVGYGTSMGNGCTSGHGVCGLGRMSVRSLIATLTFMATGGMAVYVLRHIAHVHN